MTKKYDDLPLGGSLDFFYPGEPAGKNTGKIITTKKEPNMYLLYSIVILCIATCLHSILFIIIGAIYVMEKNNDVSPMVAVMISGTIATLAMGIPMSTFAMLQDALSFLFALASNLLAWWVLIWIMS